MTLARIESIIVLALVVATLFLVVTYVTGQTLDESLNIIAQIIRAVSGQ